MGAAVVILAVALAAVIAASIVLMTKRDKLVAALRTGYDNEIESRRGTAKRNLELDEKSEMLASMVNMVNADKTILENRNAELSDQLKSATDQIKILTTFKPLPAFKRHKGVSRKSKGK